MKKLQGHFSIASELDCETMERMYHLMAENYENLCQERFRSDLAEKDHAILMFDRTGELQGFSTLKVYRETIGNKKRSILFSGDTVIRASSWGSLELPRLWGAYAFSLMQRNQSEECYWFLMTKGYKTYRFLPVFFRDYFPSISDHSYDELAKIRNHFASRKFGDWFNSKTGVISFAGQRDYLKRGIADIESSRLADPHISYFQRLNPGWSRGDELACLAPLTAENFKPLGRKMAQREMLRHDLLNDLSTHSSPRAACARG